MATEKNSKAPSAAAYFTLVMLGDGYVEPAVTLGKSIVNVDSSVKRRYCMVTPDVSESARRRLSQFWTVLSVEYLSRDNLPRLLSSRMNEIYSSWIGCSFTKFRFLEEAAKLRLDRVVYLDADTVLLSSLDKLLESLDRVDRDGSVVATCLFPFFSTLSFHRSSYYRGELFRKISRYEQQEIPGRDFMPVDWDDFADVWHRGLASSGVSSNTSNSPDSSDSSNSSDLSGWFGSTCSSGSSRLTAVSAICDGSVNTSRATLPTTTTRYFLTNLSFVFVRSSPTCDFRAMFDSIVRLLYDPRNVLFRTRVSRFPNGWDEQLFAQCCLMLRNRIALYHLHTRCNVNAGFWDATRVKVQPYTMTWWGSSKPWMNDDAVPKYVDVYLYRYFRNLPVTPDKC